MYHKTRKVIYFWLLWFLAWTDSWCFIFKLPVKAICSSIWKGKNPSVLLRVNPASLNTFFKGRCWFLGEGLHFWSNSCVMHFGGGRQLCCYRAHLCTGRLRRHLSSLLSKRAEGGEKKEIYKHLLNLNCFSYAFSLMSFSSLEIMRFLCCFTHGFLLILKGTSQKECRPSPSLVPVGTSTVNTPCTVSCVTAKWHWDSIPGRGVRKHHPCWENWCRCFYKRCTRMLSSN